MGARAGVRLEQTSNPTAIGDVQWAKPGVGRLAVAVAGERFPRDEREGRAVNLAQDHPRKLAKGLELKALKVTLEEPQSIALAL